MCPLIFMRKLVKHLILHVLVTVLIIWDDTQWRKFFVQSEKKKFFKYLWVFIVQENFLKFFGSFWVRKYFSYALGEVDLRWFFWDCVLSCNSSFFVVSAKIIFRKEGNFGKIDIDYFFKCVLNKLWGNSTFSVIWVSLLVE